MFLCDRLIFIEKYNYFVFVREIKNVFLLRCIISILCFIFLNIFFIGNIWLRGNILYYSRTEFGKSVFFLFEVNILN